LYQLSIIDLSYLRQATLAQATNFDLVLLLIISETTQQAMVDSDHSITNAFLLIMTLVGTGIGSPLLKHRLPALEKWLDGTPLAGHH
jgi:uncharacterized membrane protein YcaP (DUF421 family)